MLTPRQVPHGAVAILTVLLTGAVACTEAPSAVPAEEAEPAPVIRTRPTEIDFGAAPAEVEVSKTLQIRNRGEAALDLESISLQAGSSFRLLNDVQGQFVGPYEAVQLEIGWTPADLVEEGVLVISSNDPVTPVLEVPITGEGELPWLEVSPDPVYFKGEGLACETTLEVELRNVGHAVLTVDELVVTGTGFELLDEGSAVGLYGRNQEQTIVLATTGGIAGALWVTSDDPRGAIRVELEGSIEQVVQSVSGEVIVVETAAEGCPTTEVVRFDRVNPCGVGEVELTEVSIDNEVFELVFPPGLPWLFGADESVQIELAVTEEAAGTETGTLSLVFSGAADPIELGLEARVEPAALQVLPDPVDLGTWSEGCGVWAEVELTNPTGCPLTIDELRLSDTSLELRGLPALPITLGAWERTSFEVGTEAVPEGSTTTQLLALDNGLTLSSVDISLTSGLHAEEEVFHRDGPWDSMDILVYVDGSGSMTDERGRLADQSQHLFEGLEDSGVQWQLGLLGGDNGCFALEVLDPDTEDPAEAFAAAVEQLSGWSVERGLEASDLALSKTGSGACNEGFLREDAGLRALMVSDAADQSGGDWSTWLATLRSHHPDTRVSSIVGDSPAGCATAAVGSGYLELTEATGGRQHSICQVDWSDSIGAFTEDMVSDPDEPFPLRYRPLLDTLEVEVAGTIRDGWTYREARNAVAFTSSAIVDQGDEVRIRYSTECPD